MVFDTSVITRECATELLRSFLGGSLSVTGISRMHGGMVNSVLELTTDGEPRHVVAKLHKDAGRGGFEHEYDVLNWHRSNTGFPVPEPYGYDVSGRIFDGSCLMMERLPGVNLGQARLTGAGADAIERQMARIIARLHEHKRATYGSALASPDEGSRLWLDRFRPGITREFEAAADRLSPDARSAAEQVLRDLDAWLPEGGDPTLVHGDLWATNIIVDPAGPRVSGFVDGGANYCDVEYELAYLLVFNTVGASFFEEYARHHPLRPGFEVRARVYWLNTMLLHVRAFGDAHYIRNAESLARQLARVGPP